MPTSIHSRAPLRCNRNLELCLDLMKIARMPGLDALRGCMLVLMTVTHLPLPLNEYVSQPVGFVSAAEGFVFLSAFLAGLIYMQRAYSAGLASMRRALWRRALKLYGCQVGLLVFAFTTATVMAALDHEQVIKGILEFYFQYPWTAMWSGLVLLYNPPLLDILPMYVLFMALTPLILTWAWRRGWAEPLTVSIVVWLFAQFGLRQFVFQSLLEWTGARIPLQATGAFDLFAWQLMWMIGLFLGAFRARQGRAPVMAPSLMIAALGVALTLIVWRHLIGQSPFGPDAEVALNALFDKWHLGPLRMIDFGALLVLGIHYGPRWQRWISTGFLRTLGAASLPVYCFQIVTCILVLCMVDDYGNHLSPLDQGGLLAGSLLVLYGIARIALRPPRAQPALRAPRLQSEPLRGR